MLSVRSCLLLCVLGFVGCAELPRQTVLRFRTSDELRAPEGAEIRLHLWAHGERQHEAGRELGRFPFDEDRKLTVTAEDGDASRRFTVFAELMNGDDRLSWARIRTGFGESALSEVRIVFGPECDDPADRPRLGFDSAVTCGSHDTCSSTAECTGSCLAPQPYGEGSGPSPPVACPDVDCLEVDTLAVGPHYTCALSEGEGYCWGKLAVRTARSWPRFNERPTRIVDASGVANYTNAITDISVSTNVACLVMEDDGVLRCGGQNNGEFLLLGQPYPDVRPCCEAEIEASSEPLRQVETTVGFTCVLDAFGQVSCIGRDPYMNGDARYDVFTPVLNGGGKDMIFALYNDVCGISSGNIECAGRVEWPISGGDLAHVDASRLTTCVVSDFGQLSCFGHDADAVPFPEGAQPHVVDGDWNSVTISRTYLGGGSSFCGIRRDESLICWGQDEGGRIGTLEYRPESNPNQIGPGQGWSSVGIGQEHGCAFDTSGDLYCWGSNTVGQLGRPGGDSLPPVRVCVPAY